MLYSARRGVSALVQLYFADTAELSDPGVLAEAMDAAAPERRARAQRTRSDAARAQILTAGLLLRRALSAAGVPEAEQAYAAGPFGKPYLPARPDVHFSLSHSGNRVLCAVADRPVGCDIQEMRPCSLRLAERWYTDAEQQRVFSQAGEDARLEMFYRIWTLKESFIKCLGLGLSLPLEAFSAYPAEDGALRLTQSAAAGRFRLSEPPCPPGCRCALCLRID